MGGEDGFGGQHAGLHRVMGALDARHVHHARRAPQQDTTGEHQFRDRLQPTLCNDAGAIGNALPALKVGAHTFMGLKPLELVEGRQVRIAVVQVQHKTDRDLVVLQVIDEPAATGVVR